nr:hypothetical protein E1E62_11460 [Staphylococcus aureus]QCT66896.1 hypothetical protein E1951_10885 [Staphylococcus aureus]
MVAQAHQSNMASTSNRSITP